MSATRKRFRQLKDEDAGLGRKLLHGAHFTDDAKQYWESDLDAISQFASWAVLQPDAGPKYPHHCPKTCVLAASLLAGLLRAEVMKPCALPEAYAVLSAFGVRVSLTGLSVSGVASSVLNQMVVLLISGVTSLLSLVTWIAPMLRSIRNILARPLPLKPGVISITVWLTMRRGSPMKCAHIDSGNCIQPL